MELQTDRGCVLILADDERSGHGLSHWVDEVGEPSVFLNVEEAFLLDPGADDTIDLVVTDLDPGEPVQREILRRLVAGELFFGIPQLHLVRDASLADGLVDANPDVASVSMGAPPDEGEFKSRVELASEVGRLRRELNDSVITDAVTECFNRRFLLMRLDQEFSRARRHGTPLSFVLLEIDGHDEIVDGLGGSVGERVIRHVSRVISDQVRTEDAFGRWGEKCFAALLTGATCRAAAVFANAVRGAAESVRVPLENGELEVRLSAGISSYRDRVTRGPADLVRSARAALVKAQRRGGNRVHIHETALLGARRLIVVADDDPDLIDLADDLLTVDDFDVARAESVRELVEILTDRRPDLLLLGLDLLSPEEAPRLIESIRGKHPDGHLPIVGLSTPAGLGPKQLTHLGLDRFITKPFSASVLVDLARELAQRRASAPSAATAV